MSEAGGISRPSVDELVAGVRRGDRARLAQAITLIESTARSHQQRAQRLLNRLLPHSGGARRVGISGVPGAGKSTLIDVMGRQLIAAGHRVAVLAVDPSSTRTGGSILGDKTRMAGLAAEDGAFIRPSPAAGSLGGVARRTRESLLLCEAAGYDVVLVETVGVGQSETHVAEMVDLLLVLMIPGAGDELQGIKRGIVEIADLVAVNKADGAGKTAAEAARGELEAALRTMGAPASRGPVLTLSALSGEGVDGLWAAIAGRWEADRASGALEQRRRKQRLEWMWSVIDRRLIESLREHRAVRALLAEIEGRVLSEELSPTWAAERLLEAYGWRPPGE
ncbi:MAG TPA: methylmalonyl Co-A mutase-associated GTPase MeaB [Acidobacteria bacterium]|nr:methylmalonyl Co-A mutase-associated GTPase MeaB [Acidobacteriota bacterium]